MPYQRRGLLQRRTLAAAVLAGVAGVASLFRRRESPDDAADRNDFVLFNDILRNRAGTYVLIPLNVGEWQIVRVEGYIRGATRARAAVELFMEDTNGPRRLVTRLECTNDAPRLAAVDGDCRLSSTGMRNRCLTAVVTQDVGGGEICLAVSGFGRLAPGNSGPATDRT